MIVNPGFDYKVGHAPTPASALVMLCWASPAYDVDDVATGRTLLDARRLHFGDGVVAHRYRRQYRCFHRGVGKAYARLGRYPGL